MVAKKGGGEPRAGPVSLTYEDFRLLGRRKAIHVLIAIAAPEGVSHKDVTKRITDASSSTTVILKGFERRGLARRDDRTGWWTLTPLGRKMLGLCAPIADLPDPPTVEPGPVPNDASPKGAAGVPPSLSRQSRPRTPTRAPGG